MNVLRPALLELLLKARKLLPFDVKHDLTPDSKSPGLPRTIKCRKVVQGWNLYF